MEKEKIPEILKEYLEKEFIGEEILIALHSDLTYKSLYGEEWLIVTDKNLAVFATNGGVKQLHKIELSAIKEVKHITLVGSGVIVVDTENSSLRAISYSDAKTPYFCQAADDIKDILNGVDLKDKQRDIKKKTCDKCGRPIPPGMTTCPKCVDKGKTLRRILRFSKPYRHVIMYMLMLTTIGICFGLITHWMNKFFIDYVLAKDDQGIFAHGKWLIPASFLLLLAFLIEQVFAGFNERLAGYLGFRTTYDVRAVVYEKMQELSLSFFDKHQTGALLARINQDTGELQNLLADFFPMIVESVFTLIGVGISLFFLSWKLTLFTFIPIIITVFYVTRIFSRVRIFFRRFFHRRSSLTAFVSDSLSGVRVVKAFGQEDQEIGKFDTKSSAYRDAGIELRTKWSIYHPFLHFFINSGVVVIWLVGGLQVLNNEMSIGSIVAFGGLLGMFYRPVFMLTRSVDMVTNAISAAERVFDIIDTEPEIKDIPESVRMPDIKGEIEFDHVTFGYNKFNPVIKDMSVKIAQKEMIGLVGKSGVGKSTIINLVCRLYDVDKGAIKVDGVDLKHISHADLRSQVGVVLQETFLFNGSIYDNIAYARPTATKIDVIQASIAANAHEFIIQKPDGYDTEVGERGNRLSGGEKQRISIARAILRDPKILILDEATSSVDTQTEQKIQAALEILIKDRTTIAIAHRLSTLRNCSRILVIDDGNIVEMGTHAELLEKKGVFYDLVNVQKGMSEIIALQT